MTTMIRLGLVLVLCGAIASGCARNRDRTPVAPLETSDAVFLDQDAGYRKELSKLVDRYLIAQLQHQTEREAELVNERPYYFKQFVKYPEGADAYAMNIAKTDTRSAPYEAEVVIAKQRFSTQMHRNRERASSDNYYYRDSGKEYQQYVLRNGRWVRLGSTFVADRTEEKIDGTWEEVVAPVERTPAPEQERGWFRRTWGSITGR